MVMSDISTFKYLIKAIEQKKYNYTLWYKFYCYIWKQMIIDQAVCDFYAFMYDCYNYASKVELNIYAWFQICMMMITYVKVCIC